MKVVACHFSHQTILLNISINMKFFDNEKIIFHYIHFFFLLLFFLIFLPLIVMKPASSAWSFCFLFVFFVFNS